MGKTDGRTEEIRVGKEERRKGPHNPPVPTRTFKLTCKTFAYTYHQSPKPPTHIVCAGVGKKYHLNFLFQSPSPSTVGASQGTSGTRAPGDSDWCTRDRWDPGLEEAVRRGPASGPPKAFRKESFPFWRKGLQRVSSELHGASVRLGLG